MIPHPALSPALISFPPLGNFGEVMVLDYDLHEANRGYMRLHEAETNSKPHGQLKDLRPQV